MSIPYFEPDAEFANEEYVRGRFHQTASKIEDPGFFDQVQALWRYLADGPTAADLAMVLFALGYFVCPVDAVPDVLPFIGFADDAVVVSAVIAWLGSRIDQYLEV